MTNNENTNILEIFSSIQGEGPYVGFRQIFVRFAICNLNCAYCDTGFNPQEYCKIENYSGSATFKETPNPITIGQLISEINRLNHFHHHSLSLTGGEPLLNIAFLHDFLCEFEKNKKSDDLKIYLETNGTLPEELEKIISKIDIVSMDFKLESSCGKPAPWDLHREFIKIAQKNKKEIFAKVIVTSNIKTDEIESISDLVQSLPDQIPVIIQPVSSKNKELIPNSAQLLNIQEILLKKLNDVRIIPQVHKYLSLY